MNAALRAIATELRELGEEYRNEYPDGRAAKRELHEIAAKIEALATHESGQREALYAIAHGKTVDGEIPDWEFFAHPGDRERQIKAFAFAVLAAEPAEPESSAPAEPARPASGYYRAEHGDPRPPEA